MGFRCLNVFDFQMKKLPSFVSMVYRGKTLRRIMFNKWFATQSASLSGTVLDLGSAARASMEYWIPDGVKLISTDVKEGHDVIFADLNARLPFENESMDVATLFNTLYILEDPERSLSEIHRVLKKEGRLYLSVPLIAPEIPEPHDYVRWTYEGLERLFKSGGFSRWTIDRSGGRASSAVIILHPFFLFNTVRLFAFALALLIDRCVQRYDVRHPCPHSYFCVLVK
jgi:SAM-dependent methyltransferase